LDPGRCAGGASGDLCDDLTLNRVARANFFGCLVAVVLAAYLAEAAIQLGAWTPVAVNMHSKPAEYDRRSVPEVVDELRKQGKDAYTAVFPWAQFVNRPQDSPLALGDVLPLGGVSKITTVFCNETGQYVTYDSDEFGFNNPRGIWPQVDIDVLMLGDSFTHGACLDNTKNYIGLIRAGLPRTLTLGMASNGPLIYLAGMREYLPLVRPRFVLWFLFEGNDIEADLPVERAQPLLLRYLNPTFSQHLADRQAEIDMKLRRWIDEVGTTPQQSVFRAVQMDHLNFRDFVLLRKLRDALSLQLSRHDADYALFERLLDAAKTAAAARGAELRLVYLPDKRRFVSFTGRLLKDQQRNRVRAITGRLNIPMIDVTPAFAAHPNPASLFVGHYTEDGARIVAATVLDAIAPERR
jgi:hypothetical protein